MKTLEADQRLRMDVGSSTSMNFMTIFEFCYGNRSLAVELIPTVDLLSSDHQQSMWIAEPQIGSGLICHLKLHNLSIPLIWRLRI